LDFRFGFRFTGFAVSIFFASMRPKARSSVVYNAQGVKDLTEKLNLDPSMGPRLLSPAKCIAAVQEALREGRIGISDCYEFSHESAERQAGLLRVKLARASRNAIKDARRKSRNEEAAAFRLSRVRVAMPEATLVITGKELKRIRRGKQYPGESESPPVGPSDAGRLTVFYNRLQRQCYEPDMVPSANNMRCRARPTDRLGPRVNSDRASKTAGRSWVPRAD
jgi:hypothetical protein